MRHAAAGVALAAALLADLPHGGQAQGLDACRGFPADGCRSDICGDLSDDCCAPGDEERVCTVDGYFVAPGGESSWDGCDDDGVYQCCNFVLCSDPSVGATGSGGNGGYICGQYGCMKQGDEEDSCLARQDGTRSSDCDPTSRCTNDSGDSEDDFRGSMITCGSQRCYVPNTSNGASADDVRDTGSQCFSQDTKYDEDDDEPMELGWLWFIAVVVFIGVLIDGIRNSIHQVSQREVIVIERFGKYHKTLTAGLNFVMPFIDQPKRFSDKYILTDANGNVQVKEKKNAYKISTQEEVLDFPKQRAISRDNAIIELDAVLNFKILHPKIFIYNCVNLPLILSKLLQAQLRNVAGSLELDQMIQDAATLNVLTGLLDMEAQRWGVQIQFVKVQQVTYSHNPQILSLVKDTENKNKEIIIDAKSTKQKAVIESEGQRDKMIKEAEGEANEMMANARGYSQAVRNKAAGESRTIREVAKALRDAGETNPTKYLLSVKYLEAVKKVAELPGTVLKYVPKNVSDGVSKPGNGAQGVAMGIGLMLGQSFGRPF